MAPNTKLQSPFLPEFVEREDHFAAKNKLSHPGHPEIFEEDDDNERGERVPLNLASDDFNQTMHTDFDVSRRSAATMYLK